MTRCFRSLAVAAVLAVALGCDKAQPSSETVTFTAQLSPANEVPPVGAPESSCSGGVTILLRVNRDSGGAITSATADFTVTITNCPPGTSLTMAHIHRGAVGVIGNIVVDTGLTAGQVVLANGSGSFTRNGIAATTTIAQEILSTPSGFYFNVHSALNGSGMVRGQLVRQ